MKETKRQKVNKLPIYENSCNIEGYNSQKLMLETTKRRDLVTKRGDHLTIKLNKLAILSKYIDMGWWLQKTGRDNISIMILKRQQHIYMA